MGLLQPFVPLIGHFSVELTHSTHLIEDTTHFLGLVFFLHLVQGDLHSQCKIPAPICHFNRQKQGLLITNLKMIVNHELIEEIIDLLEDKRPSEVFLKLLIGDLN